MKKLAELTTAEFVDLLASDAPAPGGGSAAALEGALGAALSAMVCGLTTVGKSKEKYADYQEFVIESQKKLTELKKDLFQLRLQHATNQLENPVRINEVKRDIARVKTIIREQQLAGQ